MEKAERFAKSAPPLRDGELEAINALFPTYIFRRSKTNEVWTTCCHEYEILNVRCDAEYEVMTAPHQREPRNRWENAPKESVVCPFCGRRAIVKELRYSGGRDNLSNYRQAVVLRWYRGALWARAYDCSKHYSRNKGYDLTGEPGCKLVGVYRFRPGLAEGTTRDWYWNEPFRSVQRQDAGPVKRRWNIHSPFHANTECGAGYDVIGLDEVQESPFRYCMAEEAEQKFTKFLEFLTACCFYPRQIEMLMKAGMSEVVRDFVERGVKHATVINWDETDSAKAFKVSRQELKAFLGTDRDIRILDLYKRLKGRAPITQCSGWISNGVDIAGTFKAAKKWNLPPEKLMRYLGENTGCVRFGGIANMSMALKRWDDYTVAAEAMGYQLHRENVLLPKNLRAAHDEATARHRERLEQERRANQAEQERLKAETYAERKAKLEKKYAFALDGYVIRVPADGGEILDEGRRLQHCVGGYAQRHMDGTTTILFMRREKEQGTPWLTIEMDGNTLRQIHGYRNEGVFSGKGRFAHDPQEVYREFLDTWLEWLKKGSKRDKDGRPRLPKKKGATA